MAQPISRINPNAKNNGVKTARASIGCGRVPRRGTQLDVHRRGDRRRRADWFESHAASCARAFSLDTPGFSRPTISTPTLSSRPRWSGLNSRELRQRRPEVGCADLEAAETGRHDADDLERRAVDEHGPSQHVRIAIEAAIPALVAQHDHGIAARPLVIRGTEGASHHGIDAHDLEEIAGDERDRHHPAVDAQVDVGHAPHRRR